jgi:hypothetical protein
MWRAAVLCSSLFIATSSPVAAQPAIGLDEWASGALEAGDPVSADGRLHDCYRLRAPPGEWVAITLSSNQFDAWLEAGDGPSCDFIGHPESDDDGAGYPNARLNVRPGVGDYTIRVSSYDIGETGAYHLSVVRGAAPPDGGPNPFREGSADLSLPFHQYDWVRPHELTARYRWDAMCMAANWVARHERVARHVAAPGQVEEETAILSAALADSARLNGQSDGDAEEAWRAWTGAAMMLSHDRMIVPHPLTLSLQRACVKQLRAVDQPRDEHR